MLDGLVTIVDELRRQDVKAFHEYPNSITLAQLGTHPDSDFHDVWDEILDVVWEATGEIREGLMPVDESFNPFSEPNINVNIISKVDPSIPDDFVALTLRVFNNQTDSSDLLRFTLKVAFYVNGTLRIQATISPADGLDIPFLTSNLEELSSDRVQEAKEEAVDVIAEYGDSDNHSQ